MTKLRLIRLHLWMHLVVVVIWSLFSAAEVRAQPANDQWINAIDIPIPLDNFGVGVFNSTVISMQGATNQPGEYLQNPTFNKTAWFRFTVPSFRVVSVKVLQPTEVMQSTDAGFFVYNETTSIPGAADLATFTPMFSFASYSENVCLEQGTYYIQVIAKNAANGDLFVELDVDFTHPVSAPSAQDQFATAFNLGLLNAGMTNSLNWNCLSMEMPEEYFSGLGADSSLYTKTAWYTFQTDNHIDLFSYYINYPFAALVNSPVAVRLWEGVPDIQNLDTTAVIFQEVRGLNNTLTHLPCLLNANSTYTMQVIGSDVYSGNSTLYFRHLGEGEVTGAYPQEAPWNPLNEFGVISPTISPGTTTSRDDYFSCDALLSVDSIQCGQVNPVDQFVAPNSAVYDLTTWFTFTSDASSNALLRVFVQNQVCNSPTYNHGMYIRVFNQTPDNACSNFNLPGSIYFEGVIPANGAVTLSCLPPAEYSVQIFGKSSLAGNPYHCTQSQFGRLVNLSITLTAVPPVIYGLQNGGDVDWINATNPLQENVLYSADPASFSCEKTVLPDTVVCDATMDRGIYRQFVIGDADGDALADSGMVHIQSYNLYNELQNYTVKSVFYSGDADQLAITQNAFSSSDEIVGLNPQMSCQLVSQFFSPQWPYNIPYNTRKFCVTPGTYTLVSMGDSTENGAIITPTFRFTKSSTQFWNPDAPESLGDIISQNLSVTSAIDTFSCRENPAIIDGLAPCNDYTKLLYREFYLSEECVVTVSQLTNGGGAQNWRERFRVYSGRVSAVGIDGLTLAPYHANGCYTAGSSYTPPPCGTLPAGWYTVVSYGVGPGYENNLDLHDDLLYYQYNNGLYSIDYTSRIQVVADTTAPPGPFFPRPHSACLANNGNPLTYVNAATPESPSGFTSYTLCMERFKPLVDTAYIDTALIGCAGAERVSFFVFSTDEEYFVRITGIAGYLKQLYPLNALTQDSLLLPVTQPIATCDNDGNDIEVCRLAPGTYTLVVYGRPNQNCLTFTPTIHVSPVDFSRFDFAKNAYDFEVVPGDGVFYGGKVGDVHPDFPALLPSTDEFYCTTGAFSSDPGLSCVSALYPDIYPDTLNNAYFQAPGTQTAQKVRNLWYSFVVQGMGTGTVRVRNLTGGTTPAFAIFRSDEESDLTLDQLYAMGAQDSTLAQGLTFYDDNRGYNCSIQRSQNVGFSFVDDICQIDDTYRRYYVLVDILEHQGNRPNIQVDVQVQWNSIQASPSDPLYDFYSLANVIGNNETAPPYSPAILQYNTDYTGGWGDMTCATGDASDALFNNGTCGNNGTQRTLWWKFTVDQPGFVRIAIESDDSPYNYFDRRLLMQNFPGDSIISNSPVDSLYNLNNGSSVGVPGSNLNWRRWCISPGTYYYHVQICANVDTSLVRPHVYFYPIPGDHCEDAIATSASTYGVYPVSVNLACHTMGGDFGEDGSNMGCLQGPDGFASTWFQFSYTGTELADILFQLNLSGLNYYNGAANVRYRLFYGADCATMVAGQECSSNAYINNSIACVSPSEGQFIVQVTYPSSATGTLGFTFTVTPNTNPDCTPFNPTLIVADFFHQPNCAGDSTVFSNYSTTGQSIEYLWDFGDGSPVSEEYNPVHQFPAPGDYLVSLTVNNPLTGGSESTVQTVSVTASGSPIELGESASICSGGSVQIGQPVTLASYLWNTGETTAEIEVFDPGWYGVELTIAECVFIDSVEVVMVNVAVDLGPDVMICEGEMFTIVPATDPGVTYLWSDNSASSTLDVTTAGNFNLTVELGGCFVSDSLEVQVYTLTLDLGPDTLLCEGASLSIQPVVPQGTVWLWSDGSETPSINAQAAGTYGLTITHNGCQAFDELEIGIVQLDVVLPPFIELCDGEVIPIQAVTSPNVGYTWNTGDISSSILIDSPGMYSLEIDSLGCVESASTEVLLLQVNAVIPSGISVCYSESAEVTVQGVDSLIWNSPNLPVIQTGMLEYLFNPLASDTYSWTAWSQGCSLDGDLNVNVLMPEPAAPDWLSLHCVNGDPFMLQPADQTTGYYELNGELIDVLDPTMMDVGAFNVAYIYEDIQSCPDTLILNGIIADTLLVSFVGPFPNICVGASALDLTGNVNISGGTMWVAYHPEGSQLFISDEFDPALASGDPLVPQQYDISYTVVNEWQCASTILSSITVQPLPVLNVAVSNACENVPILIVNTSFAEGSEIASSQWIFENQNPVDAFEPGTVSWPEQGNYTYTYTASSAEGCIAQTSGEVIIHPLPEASFEWIGECENNQVIFTNTSQIAEGSMSDFQWDVNGGSASELENPVMTFDTFGVYAVVLTVYSDMGCVGQSAQSIVVESAPVAGFTANDACVNELVNVWNTSTMELGTITDVQWGLENGVTYSGEDGFAHVFDIPGTYQVQQIVLSSTGCYDVFTDSVIVYPLPVAEITLNDSVVCAGDWIMLQSSSTVVAPQQLTEYNWIVNGVELGSGSLWSYQPTENGIMWIGLSVTSDQGCTAATASPVSLEVVALPDAGFSLSTDELTFYNPTVHVMDEASGENLVSWLYTLSDGTVIGQPNFAYTYYESGNHWITQYVENIYGCSDTLTRALVMDDEVQVYIPNAFTPDHDGINDAFRPVITGDRITDYRLFIFDRWGTIVFDSNDPEEHWMGEVRDGSYYSMTAVFNYRLVFRTEKGRDLEFNGSVTLVR